MEAGPADQLLEWCSLRRFGHRADFERACLTTVGPDERAISVLGRLEQLGHVDVGWDSGQAWWIARSALVVCSGAGGRAVLTGARTRATMNSAVRWKLDGMIPSLDVLPQPRAAPAAVYVGYRSERELFAAAEAIDAHVVTDVSRLYQSHFGTVADMLESGRREFRPSGFEAEVLDVETLRFEPIYDRSAIERPGCYRQPTHGTTGYWYVDDDGAVFRAPRWVAIHAELQRRRRARLPERSVLEYDVRTQRMAVSSAAQLPLPWARVAMAASGRLPSHVRGTSGRLLEVFDGIEPVLYKEICDALGAPPMSFRELEPGAP